MKYGKTTRRASHLFRISFIRDACYPCIVFTHVVTDTIRTCSNFRFEVRWHLTTTLTVFSISIVRHFTLMQIFRSSRTHDLSIHYRFPLRDDITPLHEDITIMRDKWENFAPLVKVRIKQFMLEFRIEFYNFFFKKDDLIKLSKNSAK